MLLPLSIIELYAVTLAITLLMATMYVYFRDIAHIWDVLQQLIFYGMPIIYPLTYVTNRGGLLADIARLELINPFAQAIQTFVIISSLLTPSRLFGINSTIGVFVCFPLF